MSHKTTFTAIFIAVARWTRSMMMLMPPPASSAAHTHAFLTPLSTTNHSVLLRQRCANDYSSAPSSFSSHRRWNRSLVSSTSSSGDIKTTVTNAREKRKKLIGLAKAVDRGQFQHSYSPGGNDGISFLAKSGLPDRNKLFCVLGIESSCDDTGGAYVIFIRMYLLVDLFIIVFIFNEQCIRSSSIHSKPHHSRHHTIRWYHPWRIISVSACHS